MRKRLFCVLTTGLLTCSTACRPYLDKLPDEHQTVAKALTDMQWYVHAYGFGAMSSPLIIHPDPAFRFNPKDANPDAFFKAALTQIHARYAGSTQSILSGGSDLSVNIDVLGLQKGILAQTDVRKEAAILSEKQELLTSAARREYEAAKTAAQAITDPIKREQALAAAERSLAASLPGPSANSTPSQVPDAKSPDLSPRTATSASGLLAERVAAQKLYAEGTPAVNNEMRNALVMAAGDTATNAIISMLSDADKMSQYSDKEVMFAISTVSVNPGWLTRENFAADVSSRFSLDYIAASPEVRDAFFSSITKQEEASQKSQLGHGSAKGVTNKEMTVIQRTLLDLKTCVEKTLAGPAQMKSENEQLPPPAQLQKPFDEERFLPFLVNENNANDLVVSVISPMADAQMLDLQGSIRQQREFAFQISLALSYAGMKGAADSFLKWANMHQEDAESRTANVVVNSYSISGGVIGFQIGPRLIANPRKHSSSATIEKLDRQSFPALFLLGFDKESLRPRVEIRRGLNQAVCRLMEPRVSMRTYSSWLPLNTSRRAQPLTEEEVLRIRLQAGSAFHSFNRANHKEHYSEYNKRWEMLRAKITGAEYKFTIPFTILSHSFDRKLAEVPPSVDEIIPAKVQVAAQSKNAAASDPVHLLIKGKSLTNVDKTKIAPIIGKVTWVDEKGEPQTAPNARLIGGSVLLRFRVSGDDPVIVFGLPIDKDNVVTTPPLAVSVAAAPVPAKSSTITIERKLKDGSSETYTFSPDVSDDVKKAVLEKDKPRVVSIKKDETTTTVPAK